LARLESMTKMQFSPTPVSIGQKVVGHIALPETGIIRLFDPCCGEGEILNSMAKTIKQAYPDREVQTWGIELSPERAAIAATVLDNVREMPFEVAGFAPMSVRRRFSLCLFNPPYGTDSSIRLEETFWRKLSTWTGVGSIVVAVLPYTGLTSRMMHDITANYKTLAVWRFGDTGTPDEQFDTFKQIVLVLERETSVAGAGSWADYNVVNSKLRQYGAGAGLHTIKDLPTEPPADLLIKLTPSYHGGRIIRRSFTEDERKAALKDTTLHEQMTAKLFPASVQMERPLMPLRVGHIAMVVAGGQAGTMTVDNEVFKGRAVKTQVTTTDQDDPSITYMTDKYDTHITHVTRNGMRHLTLPVEIETFLNSKADLFREHIETEFVPYGNSITPQEHAILDTLSHDKQLPGCENTGLLPQQKTFAVALTRAVGKYGVGHIVGEMGTGKTRIALSAARLMNSYPLLVTCPPHLVEDWVEEFEAAIPGGVGVVVETISELESIIEDQSYHPNEKLMVVISHSRIKLGPGWVPATGIRYRLSRKMVREIKADRDDAGHNVFDRVKLAREKYQSDPSEETHKAWVVTRENLKKVAIADPVCPECGERLFGSESYMQPVWKKRAVYCVNTIRIWDEDTGEWDAMGTRCGSALWQSFPKIARRWPLADYIHDHHSNFFKLLIVDEVHKTKSKGTGISTSAHQLMTCMPVITCTGTFFGGNADSIFFILYRTQSMVRKDFGFNDEMRWTERFGVIQRKYKTSTSTSANTGRAKRQVGISPRPGLSPEAIRYLLPTTVFARLADYGIGLPDYNEEMVPISTGIHEQQAR